MSNEKQVDSGRRSLLVATCAAGGVVGVSTAGVLVSTLQPSERAKAAGAVWILRRTPEMLASLKPNDALVADPNSDSQYQMPVPSYAKNEFRAYEQHKEVLVVVGICSHLGCSPSARFAEGAQPNLPDDWRGGFLCPCHGSTFDLSARVFKNKPAPSNLDVPPYMYLTHHRIVIGKDEKGEA